MTMPALTLNIISEEDVVAFARQELVDDDDRTVREALICDTKARETLADILGKKVTANKGPNVGLVHIDCALAQLETSFAIYNEMPHSRAAHAKLSPYKNRAECRRRILDCLRAEMKTLGWPSPKTDAQDAVFSSNPLSIPNNRLKAVGHAIETDREVLTQLCAGYALLAPSTLLVSVADAISILRVDLSNIITI